MFSTEAQAFGGAGLAEPRRLRGLWLRPRGGGGSHGGAAAVARRPDGALQRAEGFPTTEAQPKSHGLSCVFISCVFSMCFVLYYVIL